MSFPLKVDWIDLLLEGWVVLLVILMQAVHHQLRVVVYKGFLGIKHAQWTPQTFAHCFLGELGLEDVLESQCLFFRRDVQQV